MGATSRDTGSRGGGVLALAGVMIVAAGCGATVTPDAAVASDAGDAGAVIDAHAADAQGPEDGGVRDARADDAQEGDAGPATCGNGRVEETESCDDGARETGDGCDATCMRVPRTCDDALDLTAVATPAGARAWRYVFTREDATHVPFRGEGCMGLATDGAVLLRFTPDIDGALIIEPGSDVGSINSTMAILAGCDDAFSTLACSGFYGTSARVRAGSPVFIEIRPGDPPFDLSIRLVPFAPAGGACDGFTRAVCAPPLDCSNDTGRLECADVCGDGTIDVGEDCDDGGRDSDDGCAPDCTLEVQILDGLSCAAPTPLVMVPARGSLQALAEGDTSASTVRDPSCLEEGEASPTIFFSLDVPAGASASVGVLGEDGLAPFVRPVTAPCGPPFSCSLPAEPGGTSYYGDIVGPGLRTFAVSGGRGPGDRGRVRVRAAVCLDGRIDCVF